MGNTEVFITRICFPDVEKTLNDHVLSMTTTSKPSNGFKNKKHARTYVSFQAQNITFNRGALFNIGFKEANKLKIFDCFIFHDVDLLPEDERNVYTCARMPRHLSAAIDKFEYRLII